MRTFRNLAGQDITEEQVLEEVKALFGEDHDADELGTIFTNYINNAINNGTLTETTKENKNIENEKENRTMKTYDEKIEAIKNIIENMDESTQWHFTTSIVTKPMTTTTKSSRWKDLTKSAKG